MIADGGSSVERTSADGVARITLNRPAALNSIDLALAHGFRDTVVALIEERPRVVVISGAGGAFCAGGDVRAMAAVDDIPAYLDELVGVFHDGLVRLSALESVVIAAIDGPAAGAGLGLALNADMRVASERARFLTGYESIGLTPDSGVSYLLPRAIGAARAGAMIAASSQLDATCAHRIGLVDEVVPADDLRARIDDLAGTLAQRPQGHMPATRRLVRGGESDDYARALLREQREIVVAASAPSTTTRIRGFAGRTSAKEPS